jgi:hypothetical protein
VLETSNSIILPEDGARRESRDQMGSLNLGASPLRCALALCAAVFVGCSAASDSVRAGHDTYRISVPTSKIPVAFCEVCVPSQKIPVPDVPAVERRARQHAREYCTKINKNMMVTDGSFDMGPGYTLIFSCVPRNNPGRTGNGWLRSTSRIDASTI